MKKTLYLLIFLISIILFFYAQKLVVSPTRKSLEPYHQMRLDNPQKYNMNIDAYFTQKEQIPYLFVTFDGTQKLSKRAKKVRQEIKSMDSSVKFSKRNATIIMLHGKNGRKEDMLPIAQRYSALGFDCILIDVPAHGQSPQKRLYYGSKKHEKYYVDSVLDDVQKYHSIDRDRLFLWGYSLGGAFAIWSVYHSKYRFRGMVLVSTFDSLNGVLADKSKAMFGRHLGSKVHSVFIWSLHYFYGLDTSKVSSLAFAQKITLPLFMVHGRNDLLIGVDRGKRLFEAFGSSDKRLHVDNKANHKTIFITLEPFYARSGAFFLSIMNKQR